MNKFCPPFSICLCFYIYLVHLIRGGYFKVFTLRLPLFLAKLRLHGRTAKRNLYSTSTPVAAAAAAIFLENIQVISKYQSKFNYKCQ